MFNIWCEWDVGQENLIFTTEKAARNWLSLNQSLEECFEDGLEGEAAIQDLQDAGLVGIKKLSVINEQGERE